MQLFVNTAGTYITQKDECFRFKQAETVIDMSPLKLQSIVISNKVLISSQAIALALEHNIDIVFLDKYGDPQGRIWFAKMGSTALIRRKQLELSNSNLGMRVIKDLIGQKMKNQLKFLKKLMHARPGMEEHFEEALETIGDSLSYLLVLEGAVDGNRDMMLGLEGTAGRSYFRCISGLLSRKYQFSERSRRPARDPFNAALNYCYGILYSLVEKACILAGLDPFVGILHTDNYNKKSLVFDLIEPFRIFAEQVVVYLFTGRKMKDRFFDFVEGAVSLNSEGKPVVVEALNNHLDTKIRYRRRNVKRRHVLQHEAHCLANLLLSGEDRGKGNWLSIKEI